MLAPNFHVWAAMMYSDLPTVLIGSNKKNSKIDQGRL